MTTTVVDKCAHLTALAILLIGVLFLGAKPTAASDSALAIGSEMTAVEWLEDLDHLVTTLETVHPDPYARVGREVLLGEARALRTAVPSLDSTEIAVRVMQLVARIGDGHSSVDPVGVPSFERWYPVRFFRFSDGIFITAIDRPFARFVGAEVLQVGGLPAERAWDLSATLLGADNRFGALERAPLYLSNAGALRALGVTEGGNELVLLVRRPGRDAERLVLPAIEAGFDLSFQFWGEIWGPASEQADYVTAPDGRSSDDHYNESSALPLHLRYRSAFWFTYDRTSKLFYVQINYMGDSGRRKQTFVEFSRAAWKAVDGAPIDHMVIDLRYNIGGDGSLVNDLVHEVIKRDRINRKGRLFVVVGRATFSAGVMLAHALDEHTEATFVGEPPGAYYKSYGDNTSFTLPHSGLVVWVSTIYHQLSSYVGETREMPIELPAQFSSLDYFGGRDPALAAIRASFEEPPLAVVFRERGGAAGVAEYEKRAEAYGGVDWWAPFTLGELDHLGDEFRDSERWDDAIAAYTLNARRHPNHWRVWYSLADLYRLKGERLKAIENYRKALEVDPFNNQAPDQRARLEELATPGD